MNDLNAQQIVLLCLLVSFVTAITTGITAVSLLDQSPQPVTQTINRVVERTVEKVIEQATGESQGPRQVERIVETVVVNQEDLTVDAVEKNTKFLVRIFSVDATGNRTGLGTGVVVHASGRVVADSSIIGEATRFEIDYAEGTRTVARRTSGVSGVAVFVPEEEGTFAAVTIADSQNIKLAQTVIAVSGTATRVVGTGIVTNLLTAAGAISAESISAEIAPSDALTAIVTNIPSTNMSAGGMLLNLKGEVIGVRISSLGAGAYLPSNTARTLGAE